MAYHKILLTRPPTGQNVLLGGEGRDRHPQPSLGLAYVAAALQDEIEVLPILDGNFSADYLQDLRKVVQQEQPDVVGFSAFTPFARKAVAGVKVVKEMNPSILTVMGGPHATVLPENTLDKCPELDVVVRDEAELTVRDIIRGTPFDQIQGIAYRVDGKPIRTPPRPYIRDMDTIPYPALHLLPHFPKGYKPHPPKSTGKPWTSLLWSRGCPFLCTYCTRDASFGLRFRCNSTEYVVGLLHTLRHKWGIEEITFYDDVFTLHREKTLELMEAMRPEKLGFRLSWDAETRVDLVDPVLLKAMKRAGCRTIAYGIEHGIFIQEIKGGRASLEQAEKAVRWTHEAGINTVGYFMLGLPNETPETVRQTIEFAKKLDVTYAQFAITTPFPGNELYRQAVASGLINLDDNWDNYVYDGKGDYNAPVLTSQSLSGSDLVSWRRQAYREFYFRAGYILKRTGAAFTSWNQLRMNMEGFRYLLELVS